MQTDNVGILFLDVSDDGVDAILGFLILGISPSIERQYLDGTLGSLPADVDREIGSHGRIAYEESNKRNQGITYLKYQPKEQETQVDEKKDGKQQAHVGQRGKILRTQTVGIAHQQHNQNRSDVRSRYHSYSKLL